MSDLWGYKNESYLSKVWERKGFSETSGSKGFVHGVDLGLVDLLANVALEFESGRDDVVLHTEGL